MERVFRETGAAGKSGKVSGDDLARINEFSKRALTEEEVYTFCILLLDNEVDRDNERFSRETIYEFRELFLGKSGLFDHNWSAREQTARIFKTEVEEVPGQVTAAGDAYVCLKGWAYMLRRGNEALVEEIEAGIKKEVSVGCSVARKVCSICKNDTDDHVRCGHTAGTRYRIGGEERLCFSELVGAKDAYEWSFVAVPAQRRAGVLKGLRKKGEEHMTLKDYIEKLRETGDDKLTTELITLEKEAEFGREQLSRLRKDAKRVLGVLGFSVEGKQMDNIIDRMEPDELKAFHRTFLKLAEERYPEKAQIVPAEGDAFAADEEYRI